MTIAVKIGSRAIDSDGVIIPLWSAVNAAKHQTLDTIDANSYQVPVGKKLIIAEVIASSDQANAAFRIAYGDNIVNDSTPPPTNVMYYCNRIYMAVANVPIILPIYFVVPAEKYPSIWGLTSGTYISGLGFLVDE